MTAQLASVAPVPSVSVIDGIVHIRELTSADQDLVTLLQGVSDPESVVLRVLCTGARALAIAQATVDTAVVERSFAALEQQLRSLLDDATARVRVTTTDVLDHPERGVSATLGSWKADITSLLTQTFDPQRTDSAFGKLDLVLRDASDRQLSATRRLFNPQAEDSPFALLLTGVRDQVATVLDAVARLAEQIARDKATTAATMTALERSAVKGMAFEDRVVAAVTALTAERGDVADAVGRAAGTAGGLVGDITVQVDPESLGGLSGAYVIECKDRKMSLKATLAELRRALGNREAHAAVAVFSSVEHCPTGTPFAVFDDRALVVYDKAEPDPTALRLACGWARWIVQREVRPATSDLDLELVGKLIDQARRSLDRIHNIKRAHAAAAKKIDEAATQVADLNAELTDALANIEQALSSASV